MANRDENPTGPTCAVEDCPNEPRRAGMCWAHIKRKQRGRPLSQPRQERLSPQMRVAHNALRYAHAEDEDFERAAAALRMAVVRFRKRKSRRAGAGRNTVHNQPNTPEQG
jgi:hypothetical protein